MIHHAVLPQALISFFPCYVSQVLTILLQFLVSSCLRRYLLTISRMSLPHAILKGVEVGRESILQSFINTYNSRLWNWKFPCACQMKLYWLEPCLWWWEYTWEIQKVVKGQMPCSFHLYYQSTQYTKYKRSLTGGLWTDVHMNSNSTF